MCASAVWEKVGHRLQWAPKARAAAEAARLPAQQNARAKEKAHTENGSCFPKEQVGFGWSHKVGRSGNMGCAAQECTACWGGLV